MLINPDTKDQTIQNKHITEKLIIQFEVNDLEMILNTIIPVKKANRDIMSLKLKLNLKIL